MLLAFVGACHCLLGCIRHHTCLSSRAPTLAALSVLSRACQLRMQQAILLLQRLQARLDRLHLCLTLCMLLCQISLCLVLHDRDSALDFWAQLNSSYRELIGCTLSEVHVAQQK